MKLPRKTLERKLFKSGYRYVIGVDEVGMGCLAGPVVVCAAYFDKKFYSEKSTNLTNINDSKLLSANDREKLAERLIKNKHFRYKICLCQPKTIDELNIHKASKLAMRRAVNALTHVVRAIVLVDGLYKIPNLEIEQKTIVKGDRKIFAIACASIIAKVARDRMMIGYAKKYPGYGFEKHKGYGTKYHQAQLIALGPCEMHRRSFTPVAKLVKI